MEEGFNYAEEFKKLDYEGSNVTSPLMTDSQEWWPADFGITVRRSYVDLACRGYVRVADGRGGGDAANTIAPLKSCRTM